MSVTGVLAEYLRSEEGVTIGTTVELWGPFYRDAILVNEEFFEIPCDVGSSDRAPNHSLRVSHNLVTLNCNIFAFALVLVNIVRGVEPWLQTESEVLSSER